MGKQDVSLKIPNIYKESSFKNARCTIESVKHVIETTNWSDLRELIALIHENAREYATGIEECTPMLHICLRIIKIAREEALKACFGANADFEENSTNRLFALGDTSYELVEKSDLLDGILSALDEFMVDIRSCSENISDLSLDFIHSDECILTRGFSQAVYHFLQRAAEKKRTFRVIVCEGYPENMGHKFAEDLSKQGIHMILVPDSHAFGLMSRINKVIIGCNALYPDGTIKAPVGTHGVLLAAKHYSVPTYVCLPQYKISPIPIHVSKNTSAPCTVLPVSEPCSIPSWLDNPAHLLPPDDLVVSTNSGLATSCTSNGPITWMPRWEYIPSGLVSLFLTNLGSHAPSYLYALSRELFHPSDVQLAFETID